MRSLECSHKVVGHWQLAIIVTYKIRYLENSLSWGQPRVFRISGFQFDEFVPTSRVRIREFTVPVSTVAVGYIYVNLSFCLKHIQIFKSF
jgi:hypothetical protein